MRRGLTSAIALLTVLASVSPYAQPPQGGAGQRGRGGMQRPSRDAARPVVEGTGSIAGRVVAADTSRPIKRARVIVTGGGRPFAATTDEQGRFRITGLPAATYNIIATKSGFIDAAFGQRRALRAGTPITLADGQQAANIDLKLSRGGVITGRVGDEDGEPLARALVSVMRYQYVRGERQLVPAGTDQTDDRGQYRVFGLPPGEYYVSATAGGAMEQMIRNVLDRAGTPSAEAPQQTGYAPTYYPGVITPADATRMNVTAGEEVANIDFQVQLVPLARVRGVVSGDNAVVMLIPQGGMVPGGDRGGGRGGRGAIAEMAGAFLRGQQTLRASTDADGAFLIQNVPPGKYSLVARAEMGTGAPKTAVQEILVAGDEVQVALNPLPGVALSGTITLESSTGNLPKGFAGFRVVPEPVGAAVPLPRAGRPGNPNGQGAFTMTDLMPGRYLVRAEGPRGWTMKAAYLDGRDVTDEPIEVKGDNIGGLNVIFTDRLTTVAGTVRNARGGPAANVHVIVFAEDDKHWFPQSRHIDAARTDANGAYRITGLPPGSYLVVATEDAEPGEWFDPAFLEQIRGSATRLTLGEGEQRAQDLKSSS